MPTNPLNPEEELEDFDPNDRRLKYTMRGRLLPADTPVAQLICLHLENFKPLKTYGGIYMNWTTGLIYHVCNRPIQESVQECWGCDKNFWGVKGEGRKGCIECRPHM